jgi:urease accessory protein
LNSPDPQALLLLMQLSSPSLPVGGFSYSDGIESAVDAGLIYDESSAGKWICDQLELSLARADLSVVAQAVLAWKNSDFNTLVKLNSWILQTRETSESRLQTEQMGRSLIEWIKNQDVVDADRLNFLISMPATWPLSFSLVLSGMDIEIKDGLLAYAFSWAENLVQACIKSVPLGQKSGQRILALLRLRIPSAVEHAQSLSDNERQTFTPGLAILSSQHETQYSRLFRS